MPAPSPLRVDVTTHPWDFGVGIASFIDQADTRRAGVLSSGFEYPGRHSRWDVAFIDPALELQCRGRVVTISALNSQGKVLLDPCLRALQNHPHVQSVRREESAIMCELRPRRTVLREEERNREPSLFSLLRTLRGLFADGARSPEALSHFGFYGAFGYDLVHQFEDLTLKLPRNEETKDCHLFLPLDLVVVDRQREIATRLQFSVETAGGRTSDYLNDSAAVPLQSGSVDGQIECDHGPGEFAANVRRTLEGFAKGDYFEVVLSQEFKVTTTRRPSAIFRKLMETNPSPYMFLFNLGNECLIGSSPEIYVRVTGKRYETCPIAGTVRRGDSPLEDASRVRELLTSLKDESELTMCTDVDRNDMARVCEPGSVRVLGRRQLEFYSHLIHTVDHVEGILRDDCDALDAFQTHMWACTVTGAPKPAAMQEIENLEKSPRRWYSGAIGAYTFDGNINTGITLRTASLTGGAASIRAGATLLFESDPNAEEQETRTKAAAFLTALAGAGAVVPATPPKPAKAPRQRTVLLYDCRDSFVHNLANYFRECGASVITRRAGFPLDLLDEDRPDLVLLSPGPGTPEEFGVPGMVGALIERRIPMFGVCLGHQGIGQYFGGTLAQLPRPAHGKVSFVEHSGESFMNGIPSPCEVGRYHSLYIAPETVPDCLHIIALCQALDPAWDADNEPRSARYQADFQIPMAFRHRSLPIASVQFHPESLMTLKGRAGITIIRNVLEELVA